MPQLSCFVRLYIDRVIMLHTNALQSGRRIESGSAHRPHITSDNGQISHRGGSGCASGIEIKEVRIAAANSNNSLRVRKL